MQTFTDIFNLKQLESSQFWCSYNCDKELLPTQRERALVVLFNQDGIISVHCCNLDRMKSLRSIGPGLVSWIVFGFTRNKERLALRLQTRFVSIWPDKPKEPNIIWTCREQCHFTANVNEALVPKYHCYHSIQKHVQYLFFPDVCNPYMHAHNTHSSISDAETISTCSQHTHMQIWDLVSCL